MAKSLVIVESPAKAKTVGKFLGKNYKVEASMGHVRDLPKSQIGVNTENNYEPKYITIRGKGKLIDTLKKEARKADKIYLATDPDREGEAISWHLATILGLNEQDKCRIEFHEITKDAIKGAIKNSRAINMGLVNAQQARRILDRLVGYEISPILWRKVKWGLSAGRVQSVAVRLIVDRENEIRNFIPKEYWSLIAKFKVGNKTFEAKLHSQNGEKISLENQEQVDAVLNNINNADYFVSDIKKQEKRRNPLPPFITSTLQQEGYKRLNFTAKKTMSIAQQLYEGIDIKSEGTVGLITYMRTDSVRISEEAQKNTEVYIENKYGKEFLPEARRVFKLKNNIQDAHEAIRPSSVERNPEEIKNSLSSDQYKLYKLIWSRFVASQMAVAIFDTTTVDISVNEYIFKANGSNLKFPGFTKLYSMEEEDKENTSIPDINLKQKLALKETEPKQHFTQPPARFTEATIVKALEENGIGRPSTYAPIISTIIDRGYVVREKKTFLPTELGEVVTELLIEYFSSIVDVEFTAEMEKKLDEVEEGNENWKNIIDEFYKPLNASIKIAEDNISKITIEEEVEVSDILCDKCGKNMVIKKGRYGKFLACPGYPECKNTKAIVEELNIACPKCNGKVVVRRTKKGRIFYGCSNYPKCDFVSWDKPTEEKCPECGATLVEKTTKSKKQLKCINDKCNYSREVQ